MAGRGEEEVDNWRGYVRGLMGRRRGRGGKREKERGVAGGRGRERAKEKG